MSTMCKLSLLGAVLLGLVIVGPQSATAQKKKNKAKYRFLNSLSPVLFSFASTGDHILKSADDDESHSKNTGTDDGKSKKTIQNIANGAVPIESKRRDLYN